MKNLKSVVTGLALASLLLCASRASAQTFTLGTTNLTVGPAAGTNSVLLADFGPVTAWTATKSAAWIHIGAGYQSGTGSTNLIFTFNVNPGATRTGTITVAGRTLTITQAGSTYISTSALMTLASSGLSQPCGVAVDGTGNVYFSDGGHNAIKEWSAASGSVTTLVSSGLNNPCGVAVDGAGNVYIADPGNNAIKKWSVASGLVSTVVSAGLNVPLGVAVDPMGNVYIADTLNSAVEMWTAATTTLSTLVSTGLSSPWGVTVDNVGNVIIADTGNNAVKKWTAATGAESIVIPSGLRGPSTLALDWAGNIYIANIANNVINKWSATTGGLTTFLTYGLPKSANYPASAAIDGAGNIYLADYQGNAIEELPRAFVDATPKTEPFTAGSDALPVVLPATEILAGPLAPVSDSPWLTITGITNGVVSFAFTANPSLSRTANISLLGTNVVIAQAGSFTSSLSINSLSESSVAGSDSVALTISPQTAIWTATANATWLHLSAANQSGTGNASVVFTFDANPGTLRTGTLTIAGQTLTITQISPPALGTTNLLEGPAAGTDSVVLGVIPATNSWTASPNATWLHLAASQQSGTGSTNVIFTFDANPGATRTGTITVAGQTLTITQAGITYVQVSQFEPLVVGPDAYAVAVDGAGNLFIGDDGANDVKEWSVTSHSVTVLAPSGSPYRVVLDGEGNLYIADYGFGVISLWTAATGTLSTVVSASSGFAAGFDPTCVAVDRLGNLFISDVNGMWKLPPGAGALPSLITSQPYECSAVDVAGNCYFANGNELSKWTSPGGPVTQVAVGNTASVPQVDGSGNIYYVVGKTIQKWIAANGEVVNLNTGVLARPTCLAVDTSGNLYIADNGIQQVDKLALACVDASQRVEPYNAGSDTLPPVLPATEDLTGPFSPASNQPWLTITGITNGVVSFAFTTNPSLSRTANISLLGTNVVITQTGNAAVLGTNSLQLTGGLLPGGNIQLGLTGQPGGSYTVLFSTNAALPPSAWTVAGKSTESAPGQFQFTATPAPGSPAGYYRVTSP